jgi:hypothetical protein
MEKVSNQQPFIEHKSQGPDLAIDHFTHAF